MVITVQKKSRRKAACTVLQFVQFLEEVFKMSIYHEWFMAGADKITVKDPVKTVQKASNSFSPSVADSDTPTFVLTFDVAPIETSSTFDADPGDVRSLPPIRNTTGKPLLPAELWVSGLATFAEAWQIEGQHAPQYATALGKDGTGFYVRCRGWQWCEVVTAGN